MQAITASDVQRFAGTRLGAQDTSVVIVGNAQEFLPELKQQYPNVEVIPATEVDLNSAVLRKRKG